MALNFQELVFNLQKYWSDYGCIIQQPYDIEKGASTMNPATFLRSLGPEPWNTAMIEPCRRPTDARYGENPNRLGHYYQFQVILKPSPDNAHLSDPHPDRAGHKKQSCPDSRPHTRQNADSHRASSPILRTRVFSSR